MRVALAFQAFFAVLFQKDAARRIQAALAGSDAAPAKPAIPAAPRPQEPASSGSASSSSSSRSDALTLLMVLQRDARLLDLVQESLDAYSDEQIGGAARPVLRDAGKTLQRLFGLQSVASQGEGERIDVPENASPVRWRLTGNASARSGCVAHGGWMATKVELPKWTGQREDAMILAPIEVDAGS